MHKDTFDWKLLLAVTALVVYFGLYIGQAYRRGNEAFVVVVDEIRAAVSIRR